MQGDLSHAFATPPSTPPVTIAPAGTKLLPGGHGKTCGEDSYAKLTRSIESLKIYLEAVYRDPAVHHLSNERLDAAVRNLAWLYHGPVSLAKVSCTTNIYNWRPDICNCDGRARDGIMAGQFHPPMLTLRFNRAGVWLPHGMAHRQAAATTFFVADETYMEVQRIGNAITEHGESHEHDDPPLPRSQYPRTLIRKAHAVSPRIPRALRRRCRLLVPRHQGQRSVSFDRAQPPRDEPHGFGGAPRPVQQDGRAGPARQ